MFCRLNISLFSCGCLYVSGFIVEKYEFKLFLMTNDNEHQTCFLHYIITWSNNTFNMIFNGGLLVDNGFYFCNRYGESENVIKIPEICHHLKKQT